MDLEMCLRKFGNKERMETLSLTHSIEIAAPKLYRIDAPACTLSCFSDLSLSHRQEYVALIDDYLHEASWTCEV